MPDTVYIDVETGLSRVRGNRNLYTKMLGMFAVSEEFSKLEAALTAGDNKTAGDMAHTIKGMSGNLSLQEIYRLSNELMLQLRQGDVSPETLAEYRAALTETLKQIEQVSL